MSKFVKFVPRIRSHFRFGQALTDDLLKGVGEYIFGKQEFDLAELDQQASKQVITFTLSADERRVRDLKSHTTVVGQKVLKENPSPYHDVGFEFTEFDYLVRVWLTQLYGSKWWKPDRRSPLPLVAAYVDYAGSKLGLEAPPLHDIHFIHFHGLVVVPIEKAERALKLLRNLLRSTPARNGLLFTHMHAEPFDPSRHHEDDDGKRDKYHYWPRSALENYIQYSVKGAAHLAMTHYWPWELYRRYPNPNGQTYNYPRPSIGSPDRKVLFEAENRAA